MFSERRHRRQVAGVTLIELIIAIVVISIALPATVVTFTTVMQNSAVPLAAKRAVALANTYADEIRAAKYDENTPSDNSSLGGYLDGTDTTKQVTCGAHPQSDPPLARNEFDDINDYYDAAGSAPLNQEGTPIAGHENFKVKVVIACAGEQFDNTSYTDYVDKDFKKITITVTPPVGPPVMYTFYRGNY